MVWLNFQSLTNQYTQIKPLVLHSRSLIVTQRSYTNNASVAANLLLLLISFQCANISSTPEFITVWEIKAMYFL